MRSSIFPFALLVLFTTLIASCGGGGGGSDGSQVSEREPAALMSVTAQNSSKIASSLRTEMFQPLSLFSQIRGYYSRPTPEFPFDNDEISEPCDNGGETIIKIEQHGAKLTNIYDNCSPYDGLRYNGRVTAHFTNVDRQANSYIFTIEYANAELTQGDQTLTENGHVVFHVTIGSDDLVEARIVSNRSRQVSPLAKPVFTHDLEFIASFTNRISNPTTIKNTKGLLEFIDEGSVAISWAEPESKIKISGSSEDVAHIELGPDHYSLKFIPESGPKPEIIINSQNRQKLVDWPAAPFSPTFTERTNVELVEIFDTEIPLSDYLFDANFDVLTVSISALTSPDGASPEWRYEPPFILPFQAMLTAIIAPW